MRLRGICCAFDFQNGLFIWQRPRPAPAALALRDRRAAGGTFGCAHVPLPSLFGPRRARWGQPPKGYAQLTYGGCAEVALRDRAAGARAAAAEPREGYFFARADLEALQPAVEEVG